MFRYLVDCFKKFCQPTLQESFTVTESGIRREISDGTIEEANWNDLNKITIVTTDGGPYVEDVFFYLCAGEIGTVVCQEWAVKINLLDELERRFKLNNEAIIEAMGCTDNASFVIWEAP